MMRVSSTLSAMPADSCTPVRSAHNGIAQYGPVIRRSQLGACSGGSAYASCTYVGRMHGFSFWKSMGPPLSCHCSTSFALPMLAGSPTMRATSTASDSALARGTNGAVGSSRTSSPVAGSNAIRAESVSQLASTRGMAGAGLTGSLSQPAISTMLTRNTNGACLIRPNVLRQCLKDPDGLEGTRAATV